MQSVILSFHTDAELPAELHAKSRIQLNLAPWELLFLEIVPFSQLKETVALNARWYRSSGGTMSVVPDTGAKNIVLFEPGKDQQVIPVNARKDDRPTGELNSFTVRNSQENRRLAAKSRTVALFPFRYPAELTDETLRELKETWWKDIKWENVPTVEFELKCSVSLPSESHGKVLLLIEFPGRNPCPASCEGWIDEALVKLEEKSSEEHIGYFVPDGSLRPYESEWCWYICRVSGGQHTIDFKGLAGHPSPKFGLWLWEEKDLKDERQEIQVHCSEPSMPQYNDTLERRGICLRSPIALARNEVTSNPYLLAPHPLKKA